MVRIPRVTRDTLARAEAAVAVVLAGHAVLLWTSADTGLWVWSIAGFLGLLGVLGFAGIFRPSTDPVTVVRGALAVATAVLVGEATGSLTGLFWTWFMALALVYPLILPTRAAAGAVALIGSAYGVTVFAGTAGFPVEDALLRGGVLGAIGMAGLGLGLMLNRLLGDREDAESRVREVQGVLDAAFDTASSGMALLGIDGEIVEANQALADFLGRSIESLVGTGWGALIEPQDRQRYTKQVAALVEGEVWSFQTETRFVLRDRRAHFGLVGMSLVTDGAGRARFIFAHVTDITSRVRSEQKVRTSEAHYRNLFDLAPVPLFQIDLTAAATMLDLWRSQGVVDLDAHLTDADQFASCSLSVDYMALNEAARRLFHAADHSVFIAGAVSGALGTGYRDFVREILRALWDRKPSMETGAVLLDLSGGTHEGMARLAVPEVDGRFEYSRALLTFTDHTETLRSRSELASVEQKMRAILGSAPIVLFAVDQRGVFTVSEGAGLAALGLSPGEVVGRSAFELYRDVPQVGEALRQALGGESSVDEIPIGSLVYQTRFSPIREGSSVVGSHRRGRRHLRAGEGHRAARGVGAVKGPLRRHREPRVEDPPHLGRRVRPPTPHPVGRVVPRRDRQPRGPDQGSGRRSRRPGRGSAGCQPVGYGQRLGVGGGDRSLARGRCGAGRPHDRCLTHRRAHRRRGQGPRRSHPGASDHPQPAHQRRPARRAAHHR